MTTTNNASDTFTVDGKAVTENELDRIVTGSLEKIKNLTTSLSSVEQKIEKALMDAKVLSGNKVTGYKGDKKSIEKLSPVERRRIWSIGIKVIDDEQSFVALKEALKSTAEVLKDVADAQYDADKILSDILNYQRDIANEMKFLYGLAAVNAHQCNWITKSITLRLARASQGELNKAEIECLNNVLRDMKIKHDYFAIDMLEEAHEKALEEQRKKDIEHDAELERQHRKDDEHDMELGHLRNEVNSHGLIIHRFRLLLMVQAFVTILLFVAFIWLIAK